MPLKLKQFLCKLGWHDWEKWKDTDDVYRQIARYVGSTKTVIQEKKEQVRVCKVCGEKEREFY